MEKGSVLDFTLFKRPDSHPTLKLLDILTFRFGNGTPLGDSHMC